jgi:hypothetical protein
MGRNNHNSNKCEAATESVLRIQTCCLKVEKYLTKQGNIFKILTKCISTNKQFLIQLSLTGNSIIDRSTFASNG